MDNGNVVNNFNTSSRNKDLTLSGFAILIITILALMGKNLIAMAIWPAVNRVIIFMWILPMLLYVSNSELRKFIKDHMHRLLQNL